MKLIKGRRVVLDDGQVSPASITVDSGRITAVTPGERDALEGEYDEVSVCANRGLLDTFSLIFHLASVSLGSWTWCLNRMQFRWLPRYSIAIKVDQSLSIPYSVYSVYIFRVFVLCYATVYV